MMFLEKQRFGVIVLLSFMLFSFWGVTELQSQDKYPIRPITVIVPFAPGGGVDLTARVMAVSLEKKWDVRLDVVNKPGGNGVPGSLEVFKAPPDGYTILMDSQSSCTTIIVAVKNLPFDPLNRTFIATIARDPYMVIVASSSPIKTMADLVREAKKDPSAFTWGSLGGGGLQDFGARQVFKAIGVDVKKTKPVMAPGGGPIVTMTAGGHLIMGGCTTASCKTAFTAGLVRPLGQAGPKRHEDYPDVPTFEELGYPDINEHHWIGVSGHPNLPSSVVKKWEDGVQELFKDKEFITLLKRGGGNPYYKNGREAKEFAQKEIDLIKLLWGLK